MEDAPDSPFLTATEARVLGCLLEKELTTPEYYPLTLQSLTAACNQRSNRDPIVAWDEATVSSAADGLRRRRLVVMVQLAGARVPKYRHALHEVHGRLDPAMTAILCELLLRNVQTAGELRARASRMHSFPDADAAESAAVRLTEYSPEPLAVILPPGGGRRVRAVAHTLCGPVDPAPTGTIPIPPAPLTSPAPDDWRDRMEAEIASLRSELTALRAELAGILPPSPTGDGGTLRD
jgi:uncharacterized protein YceH (UPF0502 family)